jgi:DHA3 family macrolide efflux protein-like MFS transporter
VRRRSQVLFSGGVIWGGGMVALGSATSLEVALLCSALAAIGGPMTDLMLLLAIQTEFPPDQIGKIYSLRMTVSRACNGVGLLLAAPVIAIAGASASFQVAGALVLVCSAVWLVRTRLAEAEAGPDRGG